MISTPARVGSLFVDLDTPVTPAMAKAFAAAGVAGVFRYLGDVTPSELATILDAGLQFSPVNHPRGGSWGQGTGHDDGILIVRHCDPLSLPAGIHVWVDCEGQGGSVEDWTGYGSAVCQPIAAAGYLPGAYTGAGVPLSGGQWYSLPFLGYWESCSIVPRVATCGPMVQQWHRFNLPFCGAVVDLDFMAPDAKGRVAMVVGG